MEPWWRPIWRFVVWLVLLQAAVCAVAGALAIWRGWAMEGLAVAIAVGGLAVGTAGTIPLFFRTPSIRALGSRSGGAFQPLDLAAQQAAEMLPGGLNSLIEDDRERSVAAVPSGMVSVAVAALSLVLAYLVSLL